MRKERQNKNLKQKNDNDNCKRSCISSPKIWSLSSSTNLTKNLCGNHLQACAKDH